MFDPVTFQELHSSNISREAPAGWVAASRVAERPLVTLVIYGKSCASGRPDDPHWIDCLVGVKIQVHLGSVIGAAWLHFM